MEGLISQKSHKNKNDKKNDIESIHTYEKYQSGLDI